MTLQELGAFSKVEKEIIARAKTEEEAVTAILNRRVYLRENTAYISDLCREQYRARYACHNEKETATMPILIEEDY